MKKTELTTTENSTKALIAAASTTNKAVNQDAHMVVRNGKVPLSAVIVGDGLGSHYGAEIASQLAVETVAQHLRICETANDVDAQHLFSAAGEAIYAYASQDGLQLPPNLNWDEAFGTTLLCCVETEDEVTIAYLGNGAVFHIRGNFNTFPKSQLLPWTAVNYLNPHSIPQDGRNPLYKLLSPRRQTHAMVPTILTLGKDNQLVGDIVMVCSDGIYSYDQTPIGKDDQGNVWISGERTICRFFDFLADFFANESQTEGDLETTLQAYLADLQVKNLVSDDCTLAVLISNQTMRFQRSLPRCSKKSML
jgi:hypothetical protein